MANHCAPFPSTGRRPGTSPVLADESSADLSPEGGVGLLERAEEASPWRVIVWNDPVNLMSYVTYVFRAHFGYSESRARSLMMAVHHEGKAVVYSGSREEAERHTSAMHGYGLWATFEKDGQ